MPGLYLSCHRREDNPNFQNKSPTLGEFTRPPTAPFSAAAIDWTPPLGLPPPRISASSPCRPQPTLPANLATKAPPPYSKINLIEDFAAFGMVCKSWHAAAATNKQHLLRPQAPWLMFPVREAEDDRQVFSLSKHDRLTKNVYIPEMHNKYCIGLNYGWFLISSREGDIKLVHPLSRAQILLPSQQTIHPGCVLSSFSWVTKAALSANPSESPLGFVLMIVRKHGQGLYYWRPGNERWTSARAWSGCCSAYNDLSYHKNQFYFINSSGQVWSWTDLGPHQDPIVISYVTDTRNPGAFGLTGKVDYYVVPGSAPGSVFVVICFRDHLEYTRESFFNTRLEDTDGCPAKHMKMWFQVYELDLMNGGFSEIKSLGDRALFVGRNTSMALENASQYPGVKPNHVYFTNDCMFRWEKEVGCCNIEDGQTTHLGVDTSTPFRHFWFIPSF